MRSLRVSGALGRRRGGGRARRRALDARRRRAPGDRREAGQSCSSDSASRNARSTRRRPAFEMARPGASTRAGSFGPRELWRFLWLTENVIRVGTQVDPRHARREKRLRLPRARGLRAASISARLWSFRGQRARRCALTSPIPCEGSERHKEQYPRDTYKNETTSKAARARRGPPQAHNSRPIPPRVALHKEP